MTGTMTPEMTIVVNAATPGPIHLCVKIVRTAENYVTDEYHVDIPPHPIDPIPEADDAPPTEADREYDALLRVFGEGG